MHRGFGMRITLTLLCALVAGACVAYTASAQSPSGLKEKLARELNNLASQKYRRHTPEVIDRVAPGIAKRVSVQLQGGVANAIISACEDGCGSIRVALYDYQGGLVTKGPEGQSIVIINGVPPYSGYHELEISVPDCKAAECTIGILVSLQEGDVQPADSSGQQQQLPTDVPIDPAMLRLVETNPFFANAPQVITGTYHTKFTSSFIVNGFPTTSSSEDQHSFQPARSGIIIDQSTSEGATRHTACPPGRCTTSSQGIAVRAANGLFTLAVKSVSTWSAAGQHGGPSTWTNKLVRLDNLEGKLFPIEVGNKFSYRAVYDVTSSDGSDQTTTTSSCEITKKFDANNFHRELTGAAFLQVCNEQSTNRRDKRMNNSRQSKELFFDRLGIWLSVDSVSPRQQIVQDDKSMAGFTNRKSFTTLLSFSASP